jgi:ribonuclease P protein component
VGAQLANPGPAMIDPRSGLRMRCLLSSAPTHIEPARLGAGTASDFGPRCSAVKEFGHQENIPAQEALPEEGARLPCAHVDPRRGSRPQAPPAQGPLAPDPSAGAVKAKYRLRRSADFRAVSAERTGAGDQVLRVRIRANSTGAPRIGISVTKRVGGAVQRNRLRRQLRAAVAERLPTMTGFDVVLMPQPAAVCAGGRALGASLDRCLAQAGVTR